MHHSVTFNFGSAKVCSPAIFNFMTKMYGLLQLIIICTLHNCTISIDTYSLINKLYSVIIFSLLINVVNLLLNCIVLILYLTYIFFFLDVIFSI